MDIWRVLNDAPILRYQNNNWLKMKKKIIYGIIILFLLYEWRLYSDFNYVKENTNLDLSNVQKVVTVYDNHEFCVVFKMTVRDTAAFLKKNEAFHIPCSEPKRAMGCQIAEIEIPFQTCFTGITEYSNWNAFLEPLTHFVWVQIQYPDMSGDLRIE